MSGGSASNPLAAIAQQTIYDQLIREYSRIFAMPAPLAMPVPPKPLDKAFVAGPLIGWRSWRVRPDGTLVSLHHDSIWPAGQPMCGSPGQGNQEGVYAVKQPKQVIRSERSDEQVIGSVALWGKVIEHRDGYRAQYAYPLLIDLEPPMPGFPVPPSVRKLADAIRQRYGCTVRTERSERETFGASDAPRSEEVR